MIIKCLLDRDVSVGGVCGPSVWKTGCRNSPLPRVAAKQRNGVFFCVGVGFRVFGGAVGVSLCHDHILL